VNIISKLPFLKSTDEEADSLTEEELKAERIAFHRAKVRNGPVNFKELTTGQVRRIQIRAANGKTRKARRRQVKMYFLTQQEGAVLRGQLQAAGLVSYVHTEIDSVKQVVATIWLTKRFGEVDPETGRVPMEEKSVRAALQSALNRWESIVGLPASQISPEYITPIYTVDAAA